MTARETAREVDVHTLPAMLTALRLPSFTRRWQAFAEQADTAGWPAARFLAALAECELAERETRRIQRHLNESRLPGGKTLATFDFKALPKVPRKRIEALAAGDWLETGANLIASGQLRRRQDPSALSIAPGFAGTPLTAYRKPMEVLRWMTVSAEEPRPRLRAGSGG